MPRLEKKDGCAKVNLVRLSVLTQSSATFLSLNTFGTKVGVSPLKGEGAIQSELASSFEKEVSSGRHDKIYE